MSFIETPGRVAVIESRSSFFRSYDPVILDAATGEQIGHVETYSSLGGAGGSFFLRDNAFSIRKLSGVRKLFKPSTWSLEEYQLSNSEVEIFYELPGKGPWKIYSSRNGYVFETIAGLYMINAIRELSSDGGPAIL